MWVPAAALMLNYLGTKVGVELAGWSMPSLYSVLIGQKGRANKSSSIKDAMKYLEFAGMLQMYSKSTKAAEGRTLVWEAGSPEGLGTDMQRTNCKNAVLFYDELSALVKEGPHRRQRDEQRAAQDVRSRPTSVTLLRLRKTHSKSSRIRIALPFSLPRPNKKFTELWSGLAGEEDGIELLLHLRTATEEPGRS